MTFLKKRRRHPRQKVNWFVTMQTPKASRIGELKDISRGGAFVYCDTPLEPEELFNIVISVPESGTSLTGRGIVVWSNPYGMGVKFHSMSVKDLSS